MRRNGFRLTAARSSWTGVSENSTVSLPEKVPESTTSTRIRAALKANPAALRSPAARIEVAVVMFSERRVYQLRPGLTGYKPVPRTRPAPQTGSIAPARKERGLLHEQVP